MVGIYKIVNRINDKYYIGSSSNIRHRWYRHKSNLIHKKHKNHHLQKAWDKYGEENFDFVVVNEVLESDLLITEQKYLDIARTEKEKCYNQSFISGKIEMTPEIRKKISISNTGKHHSKETKQKISDNNAKPMLGKHHSEETKRKIGKISKEKNSGEKAHQYDKTIYRFQNKITQEIFEGTRYNFYTKFDMDKSKIHELIHGTRNYHKNWKLLPVS